MASLQAVVAFCDLNFHQIIVSQMQSSNVLRHMLKTHLVKNVDVRLSVDVNLLTAEHLGRLSFESMTSPFAPKEPQIIGK